MNWTAPDSAIVRNTVLVPASLVRDSLDRGVALTVDLRTPLRRKARLVLRPDWPLRFALPSRDAVQFHYTPDDFVDDRTDPILPPWPVLADAPPFAAADVTKLVRLCWLSVQISAEALALESTGSGTGRHPSFLAHYFPSPTQRGKAAATDALWLLLCGALDAVAYEPRPGFTETFARFVNVGSAARVFEGGLASRGAEQWARAGRWMARQCSPSTPLAALATAAGGGLPADWTSDALLLLAAGVCPSGDPASDEDARTRIWPAALYAARHRLFLRVVERLQETEVAAWPAELVRLRKMAAADLPPPLPLRGHECAALALRCSAVTALPVADAPALKAILAQHSRVLAYRANAPWSAPLVAKRDARYAGIRARLAPTATLASILAMPGVPPCLVGAVATARAAHRVACNDRLALASYIVAMEPFHADAATLESPTDMALFVLGETTMTARVRVFANVIANARRARGAVPAADPDARQSAVTGCRKIVERTAANRDTILRCPFQVTYPASAFDCQKHCSQGKKGLCNTPLDHLLSLLDW